MDNLLKSICFAASLITTLSIAAPLLNEDAENKRSPMENSVNSEEERKEKKNYTYSESALQPSEFLVG